MRPPRANPYRDAWAGELDAARVGDTVRVAGWVHRRRDHGGLVFIDLRDRSGILQLVFHPETAPEAHALAQRLRSEHVISVSGVVERREEGNVNPRLPTGEIELTVADAEHLADSETPPFPLDEEGQVDEHQAAVIAPAVHPAGEPRVGINAVGEHLGAPGVAVVVGSEGGNGVAHRGAVWHRPPAPRRAGARRRP